MCLFKWILERKTLPHRAHLCESLCVSLGTFWRCVPGQIENRDMYCPKIHSSSSCWRLGPCHTDHCVVDSPQYESVCIFCKVIPGDKFLSTQSKFIWFLPKMILHLCLYIVHGGKTLPHRAH